MAVGDTVVAVMEAVAMVEEDMEAGEDMVEELDLGVMEEVFDLI